MKSKIYFTKPESNLPKNLLPRQIGAGVLSFLMLIGGAGIIKTMLVSCDNNGTKIEDEEEDENYIGTVGGIEFRVENIADRAAVLAAFNTFLGTDNGAASLADLAIFGVTANKVVITGVNAGVAHTIDFYDGSELRGKIGSGLNLVDFIAEGHLGGHVSMKDSVIFGGAIVAANTFS